MQINKNKFFRIFIITLWLTALFACSSEDKTVSDGLDYDTEINDDDKTVVKEISFEKETHVDIATGPHLAFPDIARLPDNSLMVVYRKGSSHAGNDGKILYQKGRADGLKWESPKVLINDPDYDSRDPSLTVLSDDSLLLNYFNYYFAENPVEEPNIVHSFVSVSHDGGTTFSEAIQIDLGKMKYGDNAVLNDEGLWVDKSGEPITTRACSSSVVETKNGFLLPMYGKYALNYNDFSKTPKPPVTLWQSNDADTTWSSREVLPDRYKHLWLQEPALLALDENRMILQLRTANSVSPSGKGNMLQSVSNDGGENWSEYKDMGFVAHAPDLKELSNGVVISAFRWLDWTTQVNREAVAFIYSYDKGEKWSDIVEIMDCGKAECGYPGMVQLDEETLLIVYYLPGGKGIRAERYKFSVTYKNR